VSLKRRTPLRSRAELPRETPIAPVNRARKKRLHAEQFGPADFQAFIRSQPCVIADRGGCEGPVEIAHVVSRGAGGGWASNVVAMCRQHHAKQHALGVQTFEQRYGISLHYEAGRIEHLWRESQP
jgi:hypothetical protein